MDRGLEDFERAVNFTRYDGGGAGHYESFFLRANHPQKPLGFWIRYTIFSPKGAPEKAIGELWAIFFDGERGTHQAAKLELPFANCAFDRAAFGVRVGDAILSPGVAKGGNAGAQKISWDLKFEGGERPALLLPRKLYEGGFPAAKSLVSLPLARFSGAITVNGEHHEIGGWIGSQNHNWGSRHTDLYAWGQVAGFDNAPESFLEVATARVKVGPFMTPPLTPLLLRHEGREYALTGLVQGFRARGAFDYFNWSFATRGEGVSIEGRISAPKGFFVGLRYFNPPGGTKQCLNTKIAKCVLTLTRGGKAQTLTAENRAAFEILTDDTSHGVKIEV